MIVSNEHRAQYLYFFLSGVVASAIFVLAYFSMKTTLNYKLRDDLSVIQKSLEYVKPALAWRYNNSWKRIGNATKRHEIYSAYFDGRLDIIDVVSDDPNKTPIGSIRVFALLPTTFPDARYISCITRYEDFTLKEIKAQDANPINEEVSQEMPFSVYSIMCPLYVNRNHSTVDLPQAVAIAYPTNRLSRLSPTFIQISYPRDMEQMFAQSRPVLSVCVGLLQGYHSDALRIVEFVEMYRVLGARHFYFYHMNASSKVVRLLNYYRSEGLADVLHWNLNDHAEDVHDGGIMALLNDCIYRAMVVDNYRYAAMVELDEILIPLKHNSLAHLLLQCDEGRTSAFVFRNVFFHKKDHNDTFSVPVHTRNRHLYTQTKVRRTVEIMPAYTRTKCIVNTRAVVEMNSHRVWREAPGYSDNIVHHTVGLLFHYRDKCINCKALLMVDYTARRFGSLIWDRVDDVCNHVFIESNGLCTSN